MGNPAWGHGYHQGYENGYDDGAKQGGVIGAAVGIAAFGLVAGAALGYQKLKARSFAKREQDLSAEDSNPVTDEGGGDKREAGEGTASE